MSTADPARFDAPANAWLDLALQYALSRGYTFTSACQAELQVFLSNGAAQFRAQPAGLTASAHDPNVQRLVDLMIEELNEHQPGSHELHEWTLSGARMKFCPLFPFC